MSKGTQIAVEILGILIVTTMTIAVMWAIAIGIYALYLLSITDILSIIRW